jgi:hypothetical protein
MISRTMKHDSENARTSGDRRALKPAEPPALYFPACGALCDAFWWARHSDSSARAQDAGGAAGDPADRR